MTTSAFISIDRRSDRVSVNDSGKLFKRIDGIWSIGTFSVMDEETNFDTVPVGSKEFAKLLQEVKTFAKSLPKSAA